MTPSRAADVELRRANPGIKRVAEAICCFAEGLVPVGWSLYCDPRMLPCFDREYPPRSHGSTSINLKISCILCKRILSDRYQVRCRGRYDLRRGHQAPGTRPKRTPASSGHPARMT